MATATMTPGTAQAGKFLSFVLGDQEYGVEILKVQEIKSLTGLTRVPRTPDCMRGVVKLRGRVIPVVSLRRKFGLPTVFDTERTCIVVVQVRHGGDEALLGIVVDEVSEVLNLGEGQLGPAPHFSHSLEDAGCIAGTGQLENKVVVLLDIDQVMDEAEITAVMQAAG